MWKRIGINNVTRLEEDSQSQRESKDYKKYTPQKSIPQRKRSYFSNSQYVPETEQSLFSEHSVFQIQSRNTPTQTFKSRLIQKEGAREESSILLKKNQIQRVPYSHLLNECNTTNNSKQNKLLRSISMRKFHNALEKRCSLKHKDSISSDIKFEERRKQRYNLDVFMDQIVKLRTQLRIATEANTRYKQIIKELRVSFDSLSSKAYQQFRNAWEICSQSVIQVAKKYNPEFSVPEVIKYPQQKVILTSLDSFPRNEHNLSSQYPCIVRILTAVQNIKLKICQKSQSKLNKTISQNLMKIKESQQPSRSETDNQSKNIIASLRMSSKNKYGHFEKQNY